MKSKLNQKSMIKNIMNNKLNQKIVIKNIMNNKLNQKSITKNKLSQKSITKNKLSQKSTETVLNEKGTRKIITHEQGKSSNLNNILIVAINRMMYIERQAFLEEQRDPYNKGNGYRPRKMKGFGTQLILSVPRDRLGLFSPLILLALKEQGDLIHQFCYACYTRGLTIRKIKEVFELLYGKQYSPATISKMIQSFKEELEKWRTRPLEKYYPVVYLDAIHQKVRRDDTVSSEAFYIASSVREDHTRKVIAIYNFPTESASGWEEVLKMLKERGLQEISIVVADGLKGLESSVLAQFPTASVQKCVTHFKRNMENKVSHEEKKEMSADLKELFRIGDDNYTEEEAYKKADEMINKWGKKYPSIKKMLRKENLRSYLTYLKFNSKIHSKIYTTNSLERLNGVFRKGLQVRRSMPSIDSVLLLLSAIAIDVEKRVYSKSIYNFEDDSVLLEKLYNFAHVDDNLGHTFQ